MSTAKLLNDKQLKELEEYAAVCLSIEELSVMLEVDDVKLQAAIFRSGKSAEYIAYNKGQLTEIIQIRQAIFKAAKDGSGPAQTLAVKIIDDSKLYNL